MLVEKNVIGKNTIPEHRTLQRNNVIVETGWILNSINNIILLYLINTFIIDENVFFIVALDWIYFGNYLLYAIT